MMSLSSTVLFSLVVPQALAAWISLSDFAPYATNLSPSCKQVYNSAVPGCSSSDFTSGACSSACVDALNAMVGPITEACSGVDGDNVIAAIIAKQGTGDLCPSTTLGGSWTTMVNTWSSSSAVASTTTTSVPSSSSSSATSSPTTSTTLILYQTDPVEPMASTPSVTGVIFATSTPESVIEASKTALAATTSSSAASNINEGGTLMSSQSSGASAASTRQGTVPLLLIAAAAGTALLL